MHNKTSPEVYEEGIRILFAYGQCPAIGLTMVILFAAGGLSPGGDWFPVVRQLLLAMGAIALSFISILYRSQQRISVILLAFSMVFTIVYLHFMLVITGGSTSIFLHLYLYMPAVVFMVSQLRHWPEGASFLAAVGSYATLHVEPPVPWPVWSNFCAMRYFWLVEIGLFAALCILLYLVNRRMERTLKAFWVAQGVRDV